MVEQRSPFFFGLTAFGENFLGVDRLISEILKPLATEASRALVSDVALASLYTHEGIPAHEFDDLCKRLNSGRWPIDRSSIYLVVSSQRVRVSHALLAEKTLVSL